MQRADVCCSESCMMPRGLSPRLGRHECASDLQTDTRLPFVTLIAPNHLLSLSKALARLHLFDGEALWNQDVVLHVEC